MVKCNNKGRHDLLKQNKLIDDNARLIDEKQELENRYILVSSKMNHLTPTKGSVSVVFTLDRDESPSMLNITVTDTGKSMSVGQVSAFNLGKPVRRSKGTNGEQSYGLGLQHVIQMVSEDDGHILVKSGIGSGSKFSLSFPLSENNLTLNYVAHSVIMNGTVSVIGSQN
jgi:K+-sensing histidine kinase KdpD